MEYPLLRQSYLTEIQNNLTGSNKFLILAGESGSGKLDTIKYFLDKVHPEDHYFISNGNYVINGYFAGFYDFFENVFDDCSTAFPELIVRHEQTIKRFFPFLDSDLYTVPKDLTNSATFDERTRFYHHEYQEKLLNGIYEFFNDYCMASNKKFSLVIDQAEYLSKTVKNFLNILLNREGLLENLKVILLFDQKLEITMKENSDIIYFNNLTEDEMELIINKNDFSHVEKSLLYKLSEGNIARLKALYACHQTGLPILNFVSFNAYIDFYLSQQGEIYRYNLLKNYIDTHCISDDIFAVRNYQISSNTLKETLHRQKMAELKTNNKDYIFTLIHHMKLTNEKEQLLELAPIAIKLQEIGVYDTWFELFSKYYINDELRHMGNGDELNNAVFVRMSFILYSLGVSQMSIPYLEFFYEKFPESKQIPMILYSQAMTYGRYRVPVDLEKAERYALLNIEKIDTIFSDHPKYVYIKVFAENALAYIRAKQGRLQEAISLCTDGLERMKSIYGDSKYALHQSILVYNTGQVYEILKDFNKAEEMYKYAIRLDPYYGEYYNDLANLYQNYGYYDQALINYQKAIDLCPPYYEAHANRAGTYEKIGDIKNAINDYNRAIILKPDAMELRNNLAQLYYDNQQYEEGLNVIDQALRINDESYFLYNTKGLIYQELQNYTLAKKVLLKSTTLNKNFAEGFNNLAVLEFTLNNYQESMAFLDKAIAINSKDADYFTNKALLYKEMGQEEKALIEEKRAESLKVTT
jgi:tetratricopeptide (TPR) repeat protein